MSSSKDAKPAKSNSEELAVRRARLRGSLTKQTLPPDPYAKPLHSVVQEASSHITNTLPPDVMPVEANIAVSGTVPVSSTSGHLLDATAQPSGLKTQQILEHLRNIDRSMSEQSNSLKELSEVLQNKTFFEFRSGLDNLIETLSAVLEPMKAASEIIPAIDQLVSSLHSKDKVDNEPKLSTDQLVTNLADQLSSGLIDPWTFKCAYMAVYPAEHPADLLHRLVGLLGTQRLSGELFRAAYEAVQAAEGPDRTTSGITRHKKTVQDEKLLQELETLRKTNADLQKQLNDATDIDPDTDTSVEELSSTIQEFEQKLQKQSEEFADILAVKEQELQEMQELLDSRWEEYNTRYDELSNTIQNRDELIQEKDAELANKNSEIGRVKADLEEMQSMFTDLQKQFHTQKETKPAKQSNFFDVAPNSAQSTSLFEQGATKSLFDEPSNNQNHIKNAAKVAEDLIPQTQQASSIENVGAPPTTETSLQSPTTPTHQTLSTQQAIPRQGPVSGSPFVSGSGSYGSGVRAQVFEVIVRQALAGAPWREICAGPMQVNNITPEEVEAEVKHRQELLSKK